MTKHSATKSIRTLDALIENDLASKDHRSHLNQVVENFSLAITAQMHQLIDKTNLEDPIAKQFVPSSEELNITAEELSDPIGDEAFTPVKGIIHRYPDRCLLTPVHVCPVYCRFCFRKEKINVAPALKKHELAAAFEYIDNHKELWEVILTGGDPLIMKPSSIAGIIERLNQIDHIEVIRIHTRIPIVEPQRINAEMLTALKSKKPVYIVLHANHPKEFTAEGCKACADLVNAGIPLLSQSVLLKGINDSMETLSELMRVFVRNRIKPYYLHQGDRTKGSKHFRTTIAEGQKLIKQLRGRFSGLCQPTYVLDIPGGYGKTPIGPPYLHSCKDGEGYEIEDYQQNTHLYKDT